MKNQAARQIDITFKPKAISLCIAMAFSGHVLALPELGEVVVGDVTIDVSKPANMLLNQTTQNAQINWQGFSVGSGERLTITQPNTTAVLLNKVIGADPSTILGSISANGKVFILNPNGIIFGRDAQINVGGLVASTLTGSISADSSSVTLNGAKPGSAVINEGRINASEAALIGPRVENRASGSIVTNGGDLQLISAESVTADFSGAQTKFSLQGEVADALIANEGELVASDGLLELRVRAADAGNGTVLNVGGVVQAKSMTSDGGVIKLSGGSSGVVRVSGTVDAAGREGGNIEIRGDKVAIESGAILDANGSHGGGVVHVGGGYLVNRAVSPIPISLTLKKAH